MITEDLSEYIAIALLLVHEKSKGKDSFWSSYIGVLPTVEDVRHLDLGGGVKDSTWMPTLVWFNPDRFMPKLKLRLEDVNVVILLCMIRSEACGRAYEQQGCSA